MKFWYDIMTVESNRWVWLDGAWGRNCALRRAKALSKGYKYGVHVFREMDVFFEGKKTPNIQGDR